MIFWKITVYDWIVLDRRKYTMTDKIYVFGHKNPDTDSILAPLVYAQFLRDQGHDAEAVKIGPINNESAFILEYVGVEKPRRVDTLPAGSKIFLVDHSEKAQTIDNIHELDLVGIVDHHNLGGLSSAKPLFARIEPLACTMSVMWKVFKDHSYVPSQDMAKLMISAIISDTLFYRSPTTTEEDKKIIQELNTIAQIEDLEKYSLDMFNAKSDLGDISAEDILTKDFKEYEINGTRLAIGVMETTNPGYALNRKDEILAAMQRVKDRDELNFILFTAIDILNGINTAFVLGDYEAQVLKDVFGAETNEQLADM